MSPDKPSDRPELRDILWEALKKPSPKERAAYIHQACGDDVELRQLLESLMGASQRANRDILSRNALGEGWGVATEKPGTIIGRYKVLEALGEGGFGVVYRAEQTEPVKRQVALKIIKLGMDTKEVVARFEVERQALALMDHPNIAKVFDAGATNSGRPYFVMDLIEGKPITDYCDQRNLPVAQRLDLFLQICRAVQHAHSRGIIHRDLKPSNVVVVEEEGKPLVKVIDFGIAKSMQGRLTDKTLFTRREVLLGTPVYMSPEQLNLDADTVDARSDVYSLGVLLYELIAGAAPYESETLREAAFSEVQRILREVEPPKPSTRLERLGSKTTEIAKSRAMEPLALQRLLRGDLDWVVMRALEKQPGRRYATAADLAQDLQRHLRHEPVSAGPPTVVYRARKFAQRHQATLAWAVVIAVILVVWGFSGLRQAHQVEVAAKRVREAEARAQSATSEASSQIGEGAWAQYVTGIANVQSEAALSPDETMLAFVKWEGPAADIFVYDLVDDVVRNVTRSEERSPGVYECCPDVFVWSPDSKWIAHLWLGGSELQPSLRLVSSRGNEVRVVKPPTEYAHFSPEAWTSDGTQILCHLRGDGRKRWVLVSVGTGEYKDVMNDGPPRPQHPRISHDGRYLVYALTERFQEGKESQDLYLLDLTTGQSSKITSWPGNETTPIWAPTETNTLLFSSDRLGSWDLWSLRLKDGQSTPPEVARYGVGNYPKRLTTSGTLLLHRPIQGKDGYAIPPEAGQLEPTTSTDTNHLAATLQNKRGPTHVSPASLSGVIYFYLDGRLHTMTPGGEDRISLPANVRGEPSHALHAGFRWFVHRRPIDAAPYPNGQARHELFAIREDGDESFAVQLSYLPDSEPFDTDLIRWAKDSDTGRPDGVISWGARVWDGADTNETQVIYSAKVRYDDQGNLVGFVRQPSKPSLRTGGDFDWSPEGDRLVYSEQGTLFVSNLTTGRTTELTRGRNPRWSPDGTRIAFCRGPRSVHSIKVDGSDPRTLVSLPEYASVRNMNAPFDAPIWSPDSTHLIFRHHNPTIGVDIYLVPAAGGTPVNLTSDGTGGGAPMGWHSTEDNSAAEQVAREEARRDAR